MDFVRAAYGNWNELKGADIACISSQNCKGTFISPISYLIDTGVSQRYDPKETFKNTCKQSGGISKPCCDPSLKGKNFKIKSQQTGNFTDVQLYGKTGTGGKIEMCPLNIFSTCTDTQCFKDKCVIAGYTDELDAFDVCMTNNISEECPSLCTDKMIYVAIIVGLIIIFCCFSIYAISSSKKDISPSPYGYPFPPYGYPPPPYGYQQQYTPPPVQPIPPPPTS